MRIGVRQFVALIFQKWQQIIKLQSREYRVEEEYIPCTGEIKLLKKQCN